jgi:hypothetical protein
MLTNGRRILLDDVLGENFALVAFGKSPEKTLTSWTQPIWQRLGARRVTIHSTPCRMPTESLFDASVVDSEYGVAAAWKGQEGHVLLLRPDRHVMAAFHHSNSEAAAREVEKLIQGTWTDQVVSRSEANTGALDQRIRLRPANVWGCKVKYQFAAAQARCANDHALGCA